jgi:hypothetical protein
MVIRWLGIEDDDAEAKEEHAARTQANRAALAYLDDTAVRRRYEADVIDRLRVEYRDRLRQLEVCTNPELDCPQGASLPFEQIERETLTVERRTIIALRNEGVINDDALRNIQRDLDLADARLDEKV